MCRIVSYVGETELMLGVTGPLTVTDVEAWLLPMVAVTVTVPAAMPTA